MDSMGVYLISEVEVWMREDGYPIFSGRVSDRIRRMCVGSWFFDLLQMVISFGLDGGSGYRLRYSSHL